MAFTVKNWQDSPSTATPITAAALEDMEGRLSAYTDTTPGPTGATGAAGTNGTNGEKWFTGSGAPAGGLSGSAVGDWYLDSASGDFYEKTGSSAWTVRGNLKGATGPAGPQNLFVQETLPATPPDGSLWIPLQPGRLGQADRPVAGLHRAMSPSWKNVTPGVHRRGRAASAPTSTRSTRSAPRRTATSRSSGSAPGPTSTTNGCSGTPTTTSGSARRRSSSTRATPGRWTSPTAPAAQLSDWSYVDSAVPFGKAHAIIDGPLDLSASTSTPALRPGRSPSTTPTSPHSFPFTDSGGTGTNPDEANTYAVIRDNYITYTGKTSTTLTGCAVVQGTRGSIPDGEYVDARATPAAGASPPPT